MKNVCAVLFVILLGAAQISPAAEPDKDGWIHMFDGTTLNGWKASEHPEQWKVDDGRIVAAGPRSHLFYVGDDPAKPAEFQDFHFKADVMTTPYSNSGIYFHTRFQETGFPNIGFESQVNNSHADPVRTGSIYHIVKNYEPPCKDNYWFTQEIIVKGKNIKTLVNGRVIVDYTEPNGVAGPQEKLDKGTFCFQAHDPRSTTYYKNILVRPSK